MERHGGGLARLARNRRVPDLPEPQSPGPETERYLLFSAAAGLLQRVAQSVPVCVVLDDLHWADGQWVALLKHVVRTVKQGSLQVIATYRDSDLGKDRPLSAGGEALATRGDGACAREQAALELARAHGYGGIEARAAALVEAQSAARA